MPRDPDNILAHEAKQQGLVDEIFSSLERGTLESKSYLDDYFGFALALLIGLRVKRPPNPHAHPKLYKEVWLPIADFTSSDAERRYLMLRVFEKLTGSIANRITGAYMSEELTRQYNPEPAE